MSFTAINLDKVGTPQIIDQLDPEVILAERKARLIELAQERGDAEYAENIKATLALESETLTIQLEEDSYREAVLRQDIQDAGLGNMLAYAQGESLDHLGTFYGVKRQIVQQADDTVSPPIPQILEDDARYKKRIQLAPEGFTTAGTKGSYIFWGLSASPEVKDIAARETQTPGEVLITILSILGDGTPSNDLMGLVESQLISRRTLCAHLIFQSAQIFQYAINAVLTLYPGPDAELVRQAAENALQEYVTQHHKLGHDITLAGLYAALYREGVQNVDLGDFDADLIVGPQAAAYCTATNVSIGGYDV